MEDFWIHEDILCHPPVWKTIPALKDTEGGPVYAGFALKTLLDYWRVVEQTTLAALIDDESKRIVLACCGTSSFTMRHTAQIAVLLRTLGIETPWLDLKNYLPSL